MPNRDVEKVARKSRCAALRSGAGRAQANRTTVVTRLWCRVSASNNSLFTPDLPGGRLPTVDDFASSARAGARWVGDRDLPDPLIWSDFIKHPDEVSEVVQKTSCERSDASAAACVSAAKAGRKCPTVTARRSVRRAHHSHPHRTARGPTPRVVQRSSRVEQSIGWTRPGMANWKHTSSTRRTSQTSDSSPEHSTVRRPWYVRRSPVLPVGQLGSAPRSTGPSRLSCRCSTGNDGNPEVDDAARGNQRTADRTRSLGFLWESLSRPGGRRVQQVGRSVPALDGRRLGIPDERGPVAARTRRLFRHRCRVGPGAASGQDRPSDEG